MVWIYLTLGVAVVGLVAVGAYVVVLYRKSLALLDELGAATGRLGEAVSLLDQIEIPDRLDGRYDAAFEVAESSGRPAGATDVG